MESTNNRFSFNRLWLLGHISIFYEWRSSLMACGVIACLIVFTRLFIPYFSVAFWFANMLWVGIYLASNVFADLRQTDKGSYFLLIPASIEEKYFIRWLVSSLGFFLFAVVSSVLAILISQIFALFVQVQPVLELSEFLTTGLLSKLALFIFFHAIFFSGALWFKKHNFSKTILSVLAVVALFIFFSTMIIRDTSVELFDFLSLFMKIQGMDAYGKIILHPDAFQLNTLIFIPIPIMLYVISYFKFRKTEIRG